MSRGPKNSSDKYRVYFELENGKVVEPDDKLPPLFYATVGRDLSVESLSICFYDTNIERYGRDWVNRQLKKAEDEWEVFANLRKSLKSYLYRNAFRIWAKKIPQEFYLTNYTYLQFWEKE